MAIEKRNTSGSLLDACDAAPAYVTDEQLKRWNRVCESNGRQPTRDEWRRLLKVAAPYSSVLYVTARTYRNDGPQRLCERTAGTDVPRP